MQGGASGPDGFFGFVVDHLKLLSFDVFGFSSICSSYPLTLRLAREVRQLNPDSRIILGGPQASVVDVPTLRAFPCVDFIIRGEADETFPALLSNLARDGTDWATFPGITFRDGGEVIRNPNAPVVSDLDQLPLPAFDLDSGIASRGGVHLEIGRGCPFACTFCSTNDFFRRNFRLKSPEKMIDEMTHIKTEHGTNYFSLVHDMYTVDRKKVVAFCQALLAHNAGFTWGCSARTDCVDDDLISLMARAGCRGIFFGIETGSSRLQRVIQKDLDLAEAMRRIQCADQHGIKIAVALIIGFADETREDLRDTIAFFVGSTCLDNAEPQLSLLAPLAGTPIHEKHKNELIFDNIFSDMSHQGWAQDPVEEEMIRSYPEVFPNFYAVPTVCLDRAYLKEIREFVSNVTMWFRWLPVALLQDSGDFLRVFDAWRVWAGARTATELEGKTGVAPYYCRRIFREDFLEFVETCYLQEMASTPAVIAALVRSEGISLRPVKIGSAVTSQPISLDMMCFPSPPAGSALVDLDVDYKELVTALRNKTRLDLVPRRTVKIIAIPTEEGKLKIWQLSPLSAKLLALCDGRRTAGEVAQEYASAGPQDLGVSPEHVCLVGLSALREQGLIDISSTPRCDESAAASDPGERQFVSQHLSTRPARTQQPWPSRGREDRFTEVVRSSVCHPRSTPIDFELAVAVNVDREDL
jgi:radical SAM superfamily enzyme YgiQ (UPF0313 family)